ncbi:MAG: PQQ-like beta-propeller repeat protein [Pirellula sp.]|nr:PQQ-like beta-propeller repeat protein [Pirellula sp.]
MKTSYPIRRVFLALLLSSAAPLCSCKTLTSQTFGDDGVRWPAFLGSGSGQQLDASKLPLEWNATSNIAWKTTLVGHGQSSPVVWGDKVFVTTVDGPNKENFHVIAIDLKTGEQKWSHAVKNSYPVKNSYYVSRSAPTPVVDANQIVTFFESGNTVALTHDGQEIWSRNLGQDNGPFVAEFGLGASPCQNDSHVFVLLEHDGPSCLIALNKKTGKTDWKADRTARRSWSSPALLNIDGTEQIVVSSAGSVDGYSAADGKLLWTLTGVGGNTGVTPIDNGDGSFLIGASGGRGGENAELAKKSNGMVKVSKDGSNWNAKLVWTNDRLSTSWASPISHKGYGYWLNTTGALFCVNLTNGETVFSQRIKQACWATPVAVGDRIYFFGKEGIVSVIAAGSEFKVLAENELFDPEQLPPESTQLEEESTEERRRASAMFSKPTVYGVAVAGNQFIARIGNQVFCVKQ